MKFVGVWNTEMNDTLAECCFISTTNVDRWKHTDNFDKPRSTSANNLMTDSTVDSKSTKCASKMNGSAHDKTDTASLSPSPSVTANTVLSVLAIFFGAVGKHFSLLSSGEKQCSTRSFCQSLLNEIFSTVLVKLHLRMVVFIFSKFFNVLIGDLKHVKLS